MRCELPHQPFRKTFKIAVCQCVLKYNLLQLSLAEVGILFLTALLCSDFCQAPIFYFAKRHFEKTLDNIVSGIATLLYVDWLPQCNGFAVSATI